MMLKSFFLIGLAGTIPACAATWQAIDVHARQRRPWNTCVDVDFTASSPSGRCCTFGLVVSNGSEEVSVSNASLVGGEAIAFGEGPVRITWDPSVDHPGRVFPDARYYPVPHPCDAPPYLVVDLVTGAWNFRDKTFASQVTNEVCKKDLLVCRYVPATTSDDWKTASGGADSFLMGAEDSVTSTDSRVGVYNLALAKPQHPVRLTKGFYLGVYEITQSQWKHVWGSWADCNFTNAQFRACRPVEFVSIRSIRGAGDVTYNWPLDGHRVASSSFMGCLRFRTGLAFDLPTEAQWEYACRAGTTGLRYAAETLAAARCWPNGGMLGLGWNALKGEAGRNATPEQGGTAVVGSYAPNAWGFYDMLGNVMEFCLDQSWRDQPECLTYPSGLVEDPAGVAWESNPWRISRGGCWAQYESWATAVSRVIYTYGADSQVGFRVCLEENEVLK